MKLKPCPFCGGTKANKSLRLIASRSNNGQVIVGHRVVCEPPLKPCGAEGPIMGSKVKAVRAWNRRK